MSHEHDHDHDHEHDHEHHHALSYEAALNELRVAATHYYEHQFDWRGHGPPEGFDGPRWFAVDERWRLDARLDRDAPGAGEHVSLATSSGKLRDMIQRAGYPGVAADYDADVVAAVLPALEKRAREIQAQPLPADPTPNLVPR